MTRVLKFNCAQDWIRTSTSFRTPPPEDGASTNFATWAENCKGSRSSKGSKFYFDLSEFLRAFDSLKKNRVANIVIPCFAE